MAGPNKYGPGGGCGCGTAAFNIVFVVRGVCQDVGGRNYPDVGGNVSKAFLIRKVVGPDGATLYDLVDGSPNASDRYEIPAGAPTGKYRVTTTGRPGLTASYSTLGENGARGPLTTYPKYVFGPDVTTEYDIQGPTPPYAYTAFYQPPGPEIESMLAQLPAHPGASMLPEFGYYSTSTIHAVSPLPGGVGGGGIVVTLQGPVANMQPGSVTYQWACRTRVVFDPNSAKAVLLYRSVDFTASACSLSNQIITQNPCYTSPYSDSVESPYSGGAAASPGMSMMMPPLARVAAALPARLRLASADESCNFGMFRSCELTRKPAPPELVALGVEGDAFTSDGRFVDPITGDEFFYYLEAHDGHYFLTRIYPDAGGGGPFRDGILYAWAIGRDGNTREPFRMPSGTAFPGSDATCQVGLFDAELPA